MKGRVGPGTNLQQSKRNHYRREFLTLEHRNKLITSKLTNQELRHFTKLEIKERLFARRCVRNLLKTHSIVSTARPDLSGRALYKEILLHTRLVDESGADTILREAEDSVDEWTAPGREQLGFREVAHYFVFSQYVASGHEGTVVSVRVIIDEMVPADI